MMTLKRGKVTSTRLRGQHSMMLLSTLQLLMCLKEDEAGNLVPIKNNEELRTASLVCGGAKEN
jgi:hypothetical protein